MTTATAPKQAYVAGPEIYYVPSAQNAKQPTVTPHFYLVLNDRGVWRCECLAGQRGRDCWHVKAAVAGMVRPARLTRQPQDAVGKVVPVVWRRTPNADLYA